MPTAEKCPGKRGHDRPAGCAVHARSRPRAADRPRPEASSTKSRGSYPFATETSRTASDIFAMAISTMPCAASSGSIPSGTATSFCDAVAGRRNVEVHLAAHERARPDPPKRDVRVGDRRLDTAVAIADRPGVGAGAARPDLERADLVDPGDAAAAGADLDDIHDGAEDRMPLVVAPDVVAVGDRRSRCRGSGSPSQSFRPCRTR